MTPRYRFSEQRRGKMDPPEVVEAPCHFTTVNKSWCEVSFSSNAPSKGRVKRTRKTARAPRQTKADIKKKHTTIEAKDIYSRARFSVAVTAKIRARFVARFTCPPCARSRSVQKTFLILSPTDVPRYLREKYRFFIYIHTYIYIYAFRTNPIFLSIVNHARLASMNKQNAPFSLFFFSFISRSFARALNYLSSLAALETKPESKIDHDPRDDHVVHDRTQTVYQRLIR
jgi:hypothetical protein